MKAFAALMRKDFTVLWRASEILTATFGFALLLVIVSSIAFRQIGYGQEDLQTVTPGILWLIFLFTSVVSLNHTFAVERDGDPLTGILLAVRDTSAVFFSKCLSNVLFIGIVQIFVTVALSVFMGVELFPVFGELVLLTMLVAAGVAALGTILSAMAVVMPGREILLPLILFPLLVPVVAAAVFETRHLLQAGALDYSSFWFVLIAAFDVIFFSLAWLLFDSVVRD